MRAQWLALFHVISDPAAGAMVDALTMPMKIAISYVAEHMLLDRLLIASRRDPAVGRSKLLVADACAGLNHYLRSKHWAFSTWTSSS